MAETNKKPERGEAAEDHLKGKTTSNNQAGFLSKLRINKQLMSQLISAKKVLKQQFGKPT